MGLVADVQARIEAEVPELAGRVHGAADLARLVAGGSLPATPKAAHVVPGGITASENALGAGAHRQALARLVVVVLTFRAHDATGTRALDGIEEGIDQVIEALAGWSPDPGGWPLSFRRCQLASAQAGAFVYEVTFALPSQLRIAA